MTAWFGDRLISNSSSSTVRGVYDAAKTPLQRLLLAGILAPEMQQELIEVAQALDPVHLLHHLEQLLQAIFRCAALVANP